MAWEKSFGDPTGFEQRWREWWQNLPERPTADLYARANVAIVTSFLARAASQKQSFASFDEFVKAGDAGQLKSHREDWLPQTLWTRALERAEEDGKWSLETPNGKPPQAVVVVQMENGTRVSGSFTLAGSRVKQVTVIIDDLLPKLEQAKSLIADGKKSEAKQLVQDCIKRLPDSPHIVAARKLLAETK